MFPSLVIVSVTPFGRTGPYRHYKGSDAIANATGGFLFGQGDNAKGQCTAPSHLAYQMAGAMAAMLALAGIRHARETGAGQRIDMSLQEALTFTNSSSIARYTRENRLERRPGGKAYGGAGTNIYRCKDGRYVHFTTNMPHMWKEFAQNWMTDKSLAGPEWENPRYRDAHADEVARAFASFIGQFNADDFANRSAGAPSCRGAAQYYRPVRRVRAESRTRMAAGNRSSGDRQVQSAGRAYAFFAHADARAPPRALARSTAQRDSRGARKTVSQPFR